MYRSIYSTSVGADSLGLFKTPNYHVYIFCKQNGIECSWDFNARLNEYWTEIYFKGKLVMQVDCDCSLGQFIKLVGLIYYDWGREFYDDGFDSEVWIAAKDENLFKSFVEANKHIFLN